MELYASRKRSVIVQKRRTSISLEDSFWQSLHAIARMENTTIGEFVAAVAQRRVTPNLSSSLRVAVLEYYQQLVVRGIGLRSGAYPLHHVDDDPAPNGRSVAPERMPDFWNGTERRRTPVS